MKRRDFLKALPLILAGPILARGPALPDPATPTAPDREEIILAAPAYWTPNEIEQFAELWRQTVGADSRFIVRFVPYGMQRVDREVVQASPVLDSTTFGDDWGRRDASAL